jgi:hypothetical protein
MANREDEYAVARVVVSVQSNVSRLTPRYHHLAKTGLDGATNQRVMLKDTRGVEDQLDGRVYGGGVHISKKVTQSLKIGQCVR